MPNLYSPEKKTIGALLSSTSPALVVPDWQRNYSWTSTQIEHFWHDLLAFSKQYPDKHLNDQEYFLGSAVIVTVENAHLVLDGQQRLATSAILLAVIRDYLDQFKRDAGTRTEQTFLRAYDDAQGRSIDRITLNYYDREFFSREILDRRSEGEHKPPTPTTESHRLIRAARQYFVNQFEAEYKDKKPQESFDWALRVQKVLTNHMSVIAVISGDEDNASQVFETLNDRGIGLSTPDLLRNLLLRRANDGDRPDIVRMWAEILVADSGNDVKTFLRHYWISQKGDIKTQALYREIKGDITEAKTDSLVFTIELRDAAQIYRDLLEGRHPNADVGKLLSDVSELGATALYPFLLAVVDSVQEKDHRDLIRAAVNTFVRHSVVGFKENSKLETTVYNLAAEIRRKKIGPKEAITKLKDFAPSDAEFQSAFAEYRSVRRAHVRYLLKELELAAHFTQEFYILPPSKVHVEHVYPQNPPKRWDNHEEVIDRLGNLTLLASRLNQGAKNADFKDKQKYFAQSKIELTQRLAKSEVWDTNTIITRQKEMADSAAIIWKV